MMFTYFHVASGCPLLRKNTPHQLAKDGFDQDTTVKVIMATTRDRSEESLGPVVGWISPDNEMSYEVSWNNIYMFIPYHEVPYIKPIKFHITVSFYQWIGLNLVVFL